MKTFHRHSLSTKEKERRSALPYSSRSIIELGHSQVERVLEALEEHMPDLRKHVVTKRWFTPEDFRDTLNAYNGSAFSVAPKLTQSAWFRPHNKDDSIPGLYIVGAGTHPGAGVPGVVNSAKATMRVIEADYGLTQGARTIGDAKSDAAA